MPSAASDNGTTRVSYVLRRAQPASAHRKYRHAGNCDGGCGRRRKCACGDWCCGKSSCGVNRALVASSLSTHASVKSHACEHARATSKRRRSICERKRWRELCLFVPPSSLCRGDEPLPHRAKRELRRRRLRPRFLFSLSVVRVGGRHR
eukprot:CAMPEP_0205957014 /NCGR_PEP_ID=MMETSP1459-20131121/41587_1 /ASSEMBLY_ACC=CAM_ASM_001120 /TAXON_ID=41880 /ORGANISM="Pycnococcus provasolii, Strain RCC931" /LENGTH=148 /DNA_ID=CAMNT_0053329451 /DNA_START=38 /DNA_END=481 /DNA_ORIENTATION=+